jgi:NAD(P) transhydrogenase
MGTRVTILNEKEDYLPFLDHEIKESLNETLKENQITLRHNVKLDDVDFNPLRVCTEARYHHVERPEEPRVIEAEHVLYIGHRHPNTGDIGLDQAGVSTDQNGYLKVNDNYQTGVENIYGAGDVIGFPSLASASFSQGRLAACHMFDAPSTEEKSEIPHGIHSIPEVSQIGLNESEAREQGYDYTVGRAYFKNTTQADLSIHRQGVLKLVFETQSLKLLGVHIIGAQACDLVHVGQSVMAFDGDIRYFIRNVLNYPTYGEAYRTAAFNGINRVHKAGVKYRNILES